MKKNLILTAALFAAAALSSYAQYTTSSGEKSISVRVWYQGELNVGYGICSTIKAKEFDYGDIYDWGWRSNYSGPFISTIHGVRITKWAFVGLGAGFHFACGKVYPYEAKEYKDYGWNADEYDLKEMKQRWNTLTMPIFVNLKGYYPVTNDLQIYLSLSFGANTVLYSGYVHDYNRENTDYGELGCRLSGGYYGEYGLGLTYKTFTFSLGLQQQTFKEADLDDHPKYEYGKYRANAFYLKVGIMF